jgi:septum formation protein
MPDGLSAPAWPPIVLASTSPFRRELLARLGLPFTVADPGVDERPLPDEAPRDMAQRLSVAKARAVARGLAGPALVIGSDQVAICGRPGQEKVYGKPGNHANAVQQLRELAGQTVDFFTGLCLLDTARDRVACRGVSTRVTFRKLTDAEIERYLAREPAYHCAGAAKSEVLGIALIARMEGDDPNALVGLPLIALVDMLRESGVRIP